MKSLPLSKQITYSIGQLGWALLSGLVVSYLVYFYQPTKEAALPLFIPQAMVFGVFTIIGLITAFGRFFDAITDPLVAWLSDKSKNPQGRRIPFLKHSAMPLSLFTVLIFISPVNGQSWVNVIWLFLMLFVYYICITAYVTPYTALIPELGKSQKDRLNISTFISLTFILGTAISYIAPMFWETLTKAGWDKVAAMRTVFLIFSFLAFICLLVPVFTIKEKDYVNTVPVESDVFSSLRKTFRNKHFRLFVVSDIAYWIALALFQTGLPYYVKVLLQLSESMITVLFVAMTAASLLFYIPINLLARRIGKKKLILAAFTIFALTYMLTFLVGKEFPILGLEAQGYLLVVVAALPLAIFGILPQAVVADISQFDALSTGENREGMFFAARTFSFKMGQMVAMLIFTTLLTFGSDYSNDTGIRMTALAAVIFCLVGLIAFIFYREKAVVSCIDGREAV